MTRTVTRSAAAALVALALEPRCRAPRSDGTELAESPRDSLEAALTQ